MTQQIFDVTIKQPLIWIASIKSQSTRVTEKKSFGTLKYFV